MRTAIDDFIDRISSINSDDLISVKELATCTLLSEATLYRLRLKKSGPSYLRLADGSIRYLKKDIIVWIKEAYCTTSIQHRSLTIKKEEGSIC